MWPRAIQVLALATALRGVPSSALAAQADGVAGLSALSVAAITLVAGVAVATLAGVILLLVARRAGAAGERASAAERRIEANEEMVTDALRRRTINRGRLRFDDEVVAGSRLPQPADSTSRPKRRAG